MHEPVRVMCQHYDSKRRTNITDSMFDEWLGGIPSIAHAINYDCMGGH